MSQTRLPKGYANWEQFYTEYPEKRPRGGETVVPAAGGGDVRAKGGGLRAFIAAYSPVVYDPEALGAIAEGFVSAARAAVGGGVNTSRVFPKPGPRPGEDSDTARQRSARWVELAQERAIGVGLWGVWREVMAEFGVTAEEMQTWGFHAEPDDADNAAPAADDGNAVSPV